MKNKLLWLWRFLVTIFLIYSSWHFYQNTSNWAAQTEFDWKVTLKILELEEKFIVKDETFDLELWRGYKINPTMKGGGNG